MPLGFKNSRAKKHRHEEELHSRDKLIHKITDFFSYPNEYFIQQYKDSTNRSGRSPLGNRPNAAIGVRIFTIILFSVLGLFVAYSTLHGISDGKIWWPRRYSYGHWVYRDRNPQAYWIWVVIYAAMSVWMLRGSVLELKIVEKMLKERREKNS